ncbi:MAG: sporulation protein [Bacillota bacterium]|nr:sporulation protein [Bacillota bacterium]
MRRKTGFLVLCCFVFFIASGCSSTGKSSDTKLAIIKTANPSPVTISQKKKTDKVESIKHDVSSLPELYDVAVVKGKKNTLVAYKVKHLYRFKMKKIESNINKMLEKKYSKENFTVSSDYKIFLEAVRLNEKTKDKNYSKKKAESRLQEIIKMANEMT